MDLWPPSTEIVSSSAQTVHHDRILTSTSGNVQASWTNCKSSSDSRDGVFENGQPAVGLRHSSPVPTLGSNDKTSSQHRLAARKARRSTHPGNKRAYLENNKYKIYRGRKRQDKGQDGRPVWPDHIEESFQNALIHIPPMGRKKKTQYGRPRGRNELIAEWIFQETGETRDRKQISSHIQVLSGRLKDVPEWKKLTAAKSDEDGHESDNLGGGYYYESIADQVRLQRQLTQAKKAAETAGSWPDMVLPKHSLSGLAFELWVGAPENITQALHNYTRLPNNHTTLPPVPLEDFDNWRDLFPSLDRTLHSEPDSDFDIILVRSSFALMSDFPPKTSKLGLVLDLDFRNPGRNTIKALSELKYWSSVNHIYLNGHPIRKTEHKECQSAEFGLVKPFFEADWWASYFTKLTHKKKEAESSQDGYATANADDYSRSLFRGLSIMQEVFASPFQEDQSGMPRRRMAILLWVFSQAHKGQAGVTSWQRVISPPSRARRNSPSAPPGTLGSSLPPFVLDSMAESSYDAPMLGEDFIPRSTEADIPPSPTFFTTNTYHSGFTPSQTVNQDHLKFYDFVSTGFTPRLNDYSSHKDDLFNFDTTMDSLQNSSTFQHPVSIFDHLPSDHNLETSFTNAHGFQAPSSTDADVPDRQHCLANFDMSTHEMLQAQISDMIPNDQHSLQNDHSVPAAESQISMTNHLNNLKLKIEDTGEAFIGQSGSIAASPAQIMVYKQTALCHPSAFESPKIARPPILPHNSFAGVLHRINDGEEPSHDQLAFDTPTRHDFARLMESHYVNADDDIFTSGIAHNTRYIAHIDGSNTLRSRSQPILPSNVSPSVHESGIIFLDSPEDQTNLKTEPEN